MNSEQQAKSNRIVCASSTLLQLVFIILKLTKSVDWSWWIVMLPTILSVAYVIVLFLIVLICVGIAEMIERFEAKQIYKDRKDDN